MKSDRNDYLALESVYSQVTTKQKELVKEGVINPHPDKVQSLLNKAVKQHADQAVTELVQAGIIKDPGAHEQALEILIRHFELSMGHVDEVEGSM